MNSRHVMIEFNPNWLDKVGFLTNTNEYISFANDRRIRVGFNITEKDALRFAIGPLFTAQELPDHTWVRIRPATIDVVRSEVPFAATHIPERHLLYRMHEFFYNGTLVWLTTLSNIDRKEHPCTPWPDKKYYPSRVSVLFDLLEGRFTDKKIAAITGHRNFHKLRGRINVLDKPPTPEDIALYHDFVHFHRLSAAVHDIKRVSNINEMDESWYRETLNNLMIRYIKFCEAIFLPTAK